MERLEAIEHGCLLPRGIIESSVNLRRLLRSRNFKFLFLITSQSRLSLHCRWQDDQRNACDGLQCCQLFVSRLHFFIGQAILRAPKRLRKLAGLTPNLLWKALRKALALRKPSDAPTPSIGTSCSARRRRASSKRRVSTNTAGVTLNACL